MKIVAFEGTTPTEEIPVSWGGVVAEHDEEIHSSRGGRTRQPLETLVKAGLVTNLPLSVSLKDGVSAEGLRAVLVRRGQVGDLVLAGKRKGILCQTSNDEFRVAVVREGRPWEDFARSAIGRLLLAGIDAGLDDGAKSLVDTAMAIDPVHPWVHAFRCHITGSDFSLTIASQLLRSDDAKRRFDDAMAVLRRDPQELKYVDGAAAEGGLPVEIAVEILRAHQKFDRSSQVFASKHAPWLWTPTSGRRLSEMLNASATFVFQSKPRNGVTTLGLKQELAASLASTLLDKILSDEDVPGFLFDEETATAIDTISRPTEDTRLYKRDRSGTFKEVQISRVSNGTGLYDLAQEQEFTVLGCHTGLEQDGKLVEISVGSTTRIRCQGQDADGLGILLSGTLYQLLLFTISCTGARRTKYQLKSVTRPSGRTVIPFVPVPYFDGVFAPVDLTAEFSEGSLAVGDDMIDLPRRAEDLTTWARAWGDVVVNSPKWYEHPDPWLWASPFRGRLGPLARILLVLAREDHPLPIGELGEKMTERFGTSEIPSNTRKYAEELFVLNVQDQFSLTAAGEAAAESLKGWSTR